MRENVVTLTLAEVKDLVIRAYETGFCDGEDSYNNHSNEDFKEYSDAEDYWERYVMQNHLKTTKS